LYPAKTKLTSDHQRVKTTDIRQGFLQFLRLGRGVFPAFLQSDFFPFLGVEIFKSRFGCSLHFLKRDQSLNEME
jgi:hypothetical protein